MKIIKQTLIGLGVLAIGFKIGYDYSGTEIIRAIEKFDGYACFTIKDMFNGKKHFIGAHYE